MEQGIEEFLRLLDFRRFSGTVVWVVQAANGREYLVWVKEKGPPKRA